MNVWCIPTGRRQWLASRGRQQTGRSLDEEAEMGCEVNETNQIPSGKLT